MWWFVKSSLTIDRLGCIAKEGRSTSIKIYALMEGPFVIRNNKTAQRKVLGPDILRTSWNNSCWRPGSKLEAGPRKFGKISIRVQTSMTRTCGHPWPQGGAKRLPPEKPSGWSLVPYVKEEPRSRHSCSQQGMPFLLHESGRTEVISYHLALSCLTTIGNLGGRFGYFYVFLLGGGEGGVRGAWGVGGEDFLLKISGGGGGARGRGCLREIWGGGGGLNIFFRAEIPTKEQKDYGCVFFTYSWGLLLMVRLFYLRWDNRKQKRPNLISHRGQPQAKKTKPNFWMGGNWKRRDHTDLPP